eukprot:14797689-Alexandrium_andersonii.AAC.1
MRPGDSEHPLFPPGEADPRFAADRVAQPGLQARHDPPPLAQSRHSGKVTLKQALDLPAQAVRGWKPFARTAGLSLHFAHGGPQSAL